MDALQEHYPALMAEEQIEMATLLNLFTKQPDSKKGARELHRRQSQYLRRKQNAIRALYPKKKDAEAEQVEPFDASLYFEDEKQDMKRWFEEQGIEAQ